MVCMYRQRAALAVLIAGVIAAGCGSDQESESEGADESNSPAQADKQKPKKSARAQMVECIERDGMDVTHDDQDAATATEYTVEGDKGKKMKAVVKIHSNRDDAKRSSAQAGEKKFLNSVPFGRAELIVHAATNTEAGIIANCVSAEYNK